METQPLQDINAAPVPSITPEAVATSPEVSVADKRAKYQVVRGRGEDTIELGDASASIRETAGTTEAKKKEKTGVSGEEKEHFTDDDEVSGGLGQ